MEALDDPSTEILPAAEIPTAVEDTSLVGRSLGKFLIVEKVGHGGSGDVYRAEQPQLGRSAVIKVLRRSPTMSATRIDRFLREAKLASRLDHPYAAHVYAFGAEPDGELWIAMEHVRGATLDELVVRRGAVPPAIFGPLFGRLCEVVHSAHELGIVHRDIKGSNVMVIERAGQLLPKLLDFGIAKSDAGDEPAPTGATAPSRDDKELTQEGATLGSPHYMSPEQWLHPSEVDARADIYALGVLAYRCVSGTVPFRFADRAALIEAHLHAPPPPLPERVPPAVAEAILRALEKDPGARWQTALALGTAIQRAVGTATQELIPIFDPYTRDVWLRAGPQPIADAIARVAEASTGGDCELALRDLVGITCRWLAVLALATIRGNAGDPDIRDRARAVVGRDDSQPWLELARAIARANTRSGDTVPGRGVPGLTAALAGSDALAAIAERLDDELRSRSPDTLAMDVTAAADALRPLEPLLAYHLVVGRGAEWAESWIGARRRDRERVLVWGDALDDGEVALLDAAGKVVARLSPLAQVIAPMPSADAEMFLLWRGGRGPARLVAAPWGFEVDDDAAGLRFATLTTEDSETSQDAAGDASPYPGLAAYGEADAARFVGREREIEALANRLVRAPMIAVLGPSGAGKSSFIHAGLLARLEGNGHRVVTMRPGRHPMHALAALPPITSDSESGTATAERLRALGESAARGLVVVIDQFEELVTLCSDPAERTRFADTLAAAATDSRAPVRIVVTLRDDFAAVIESEASLRGRFEVFVLGTPSPEALRRIVVEPARRSGVVVEASVVDHMVAEVAGRPASLPLLSFTATQLWRTRDKVGRRITREAYDAIGGVAGALSTYADQIYDSLARKDQQVVRTLFARLVASDGTRIPAPRAELEQLPDTAPVLAHLIDARLLVVREDDDLGHLIEIVHECLAERWDRLARWRREDATDRALLGDVRAAARRWHDTGERPDLLWRGEALAELRKLIAREPALTDAERAFTTAADLADRRARWLRRGAVATAIASLVAVAVVMAYLGFAAKRSRDEAQDSAADAHTQAKLADDRLTASLIAQGTSQLNDGRELPALAYFAEALRRGADSTGLREMIAIATRGWPDEVLRDSTPSSAMAVLPDGGYVVGSPDSHVRWIDRTGKPLIGDLMLDLGPITYVRLQGDDVIVIADKGAAVIEPRCCTVRVRLPHDTFIHGAAVGPAPDEISTLEKDGLHVYGWDGTAKRAAAPMPGKTFADVAFDATARHALTWADGALATVDLTTMVARPIAKDLFGDVAAAAGGRAFAYLDEARAVHLIRVDGTPIATLHPTNRAIAVVLSDTGDRLVAISEHEASVFDGAGKLLRAFAIEASGGARASGDDLWTGSHDGKLRRYHAGMLVASIPAHVGDIEQLELSVSAGLVAAIGSDSQLGIWRATAAQLRLEEPPCPRTGQWPVQMGILSTCSDGRNLVYVGKHLVGEAAKLGDDTPMLAYDPESGRGAFEAADVTAVYDRDGKRIAVSSKVHPLDIAFDDPDHLLVLEDPDGALWRWTYATDAWERVVDAKKSMAMASLGGGAVMIAFEDGHAGTFVGGQEVRRLDAGGRVGYIAVSRDRRWVALQLTSGAMVIAEAATGRVTHRLGAGDNGDVEPSFDDTGDLVLRPANGVTSIWDRDTGLALVTNLDLLKLQGGVVFGAHGSLELQGERTGTLAVTRDDRPAAAVIADIACRVPLAVVDGRLEPATPRCP